MTEWREVFERVPREMFTPSLVWVDSGSGPWTGIDRDTDPQAWAAAVAADQPLITQFDDGESEGEGRPTSSLSVPTLVERFLDQLNPAPYDRVLEIGTGSGWTAALLSSVVGEQNVTSVEVDASVAKQAAANLEAAGFAPNLIIGDGATVLPDGGPFDRVHVTCAVRAIPYAWVELTRPGGVIVAPYAGGFGYGAVVRLDVLPDGMAVGRFSGSADYMLLRSHRPVDGRPGDWVNVGGDIRVSETRLDPRRFQQEPVSVDVSVAAMVPGVFSRSFEDSEPTGEMTLWILDSNGPGGSWASVDYVPGDATYRVEQAGDRNLWDEVEAAYFKWVGWGRPDITRFGMTVTPDGQQIWLDDPARVVGEE